ncbi:hypothetical protein [Bacteroides thetaiotaomicron]|uniref:hypothetical protein n=1 Tax=Bacteroides thetaiotaomicron TaxID=818 RepID=UPI001F5BD66D|nr:hypothetical protein [Bacteroides thetaiotaomicron]
MYRALSDGEKLVATDYSWNDDVTIELSASAKAKLRKGTNICSTLSQHNRRSIR